ncbi:MAG: hypothetical protein ACLRFH_02790 [Opitutales bacterium]
MKKFVFFCGIWNYLLFNLGGSEIDFRPSTLNPFCEVYEEQPNEFYNRRRLNIADNDENSLMELLLNYANLLVEIETKELEEDLRVWFEAQLDTIFSLQDSVDYEFYKQSLREDLEWYAVIYSDLPVLNSLKNFIESL